MNTEMDSSGTAPDAVAQDAEALKRRQDELQAEGAAVLADLDLLALLGRVGDLMLLGSYALGVMVWRDIDLHVYCDEYSADRCFEAMRPLASHPRVKKLRWDNERDAMNTGWLPNGYYFGVRYWTPERVEWKADIWFLPRSLEATGRANLAELRAALTPEGRAAILRIKDAWRTNPDYRSVAVYDAVLRHGARTLADFQRYLAERQAAL